MGTKKKALNRPKTRQIYQPLSPLFYAGLILVQGLPDASVDGPGDDALVGVLLPGGPHVPCLLVLGELQHPLSGLLPFPPLQGHMVCGPRQGRPGHLCVESNTVVTGGQTCSMLSIWLTLAVVAAVLTLLCNCIHG